MSLAYPTHKPIKARFRFLVSFLWCGENGLSSLGAQKWRKLKCFYGTDKYCNFLQNTTLKGIFFSIVYHCFPDTDRMPLVVSKRCKSRQGKRELDQNKLLHEVQRESASRLKSSFWIKTGRPRLKGCWTEMKWCQYILSLRFWHEARLTAGLTMAQSILSSNLPLPAVNELFLVEKELVHLILK